jgi:hypothetical protein
MIRFSDQAGPELLAAGYSCAKIQRDIHENIK